MKFGQLIEHNLRDIFVEKSYTKRAGETIPRHYSQGLLKNRKWSGISIPASFSA